MTMPPVNRRDFSARLAAIAMLGVPGASLTSITSARVSDPDDGISHDAAAIHQEGVFAVGPARVYEALLDAKQFSAMSGGQPAEIDRVEGGAFSLFGARIKGRNVELVANKRIVQAWRSEAWARGEYSIVRFELVAEGTGTRLVLDHGGFPKDDAQSLATGWKAHYWDFLAKYLGTGAARP
jgi:activator of HSP90 ATPase